MKLPKVFQKIKVPTFFSGKNIYRKYKLYLYKDQEEGKIVFFEKVKKDFVFTALVAAIKKLKKTSTKFGKISAKQAKKIKKFRATSDDLIRFPGTNSFINKKMDQYVSQIKDNWKKTHPNWELWQQEFSFIEFFESEKDVYDITFELKIWVTRGPE